MFTSRAEYRLALRQDNADSRLMRHGHALGLISPKTLERLDAKETRVASARAYILSERLTRDELRVVLGNHADTVIPDSESLNQLLRRPEVTLEGILRVGRVRTSEVIKDLISDVDAMRRVEIEVKYEGYLKRQDEQIALFKKNEAMTIPEEFDYAAVKSISNEGREKLGRIRPRSIGQAMRISGVSPADVSILMISMMR
jgi:tRNA uridine 5-carboxymethylaminomethyl modification enzyme